VEKKLKLTKLTVANLDRVKGGIDHCACQVGVGDGVFNRDHPTLVKSVCVCLFPD